MPSSHIDQTDHDPEEAFVPTVFYEARSQALKESIPALRVVQ